MRISPKSVQASSTAVHSAAKESSRTSFFDTLAGISKTQVQKASTAQSERQSRSDADASGASQSGQATQKSSLIDNSENATAATQQSKSESLRTQQGGAATSASDSKASVEKSVDDEDQSESRKTSVKKSGAVGQVSSSSVQDPTAQASLTVAPSALTTTVTDASTGSVDLTGESTGGQAASGISDQATDAQVQTYAQLLEAGKGTDARMSASQLRTDRSGDDVSAVELDSAGDAANETSSTTGAATESAAGDTDAAQAAEPSAALQASLAAGFGTRVGSNQNSASVDQPAVSPIQSKSSGTASSLRGDASKADKSEDSNGTHTPTQNFSAALNESQSALGANSHSSSTGGDAAALQTVATTAHVESRTTADSPTASGPAEATAHRPDTSEGTSADQLPGSPIAGMSGISAATLVQNMNGTEMRVGMRSSEFGDISIRTAVSQQQMQTQISVNHSELSSALSAHIPSVQAKLGSDYGLHATIEVNQSGTSFSNHGGHSQSQQQQALVRRIDSIDTTSASELDAISVSNMIYASSDSRLDVRV